jgi:hypothetical protein
MAMRPAGHPPTAASACGRDNAALRITDQRQRPVGGRFDVRRSDPHQPLGQVLTARSLTRSVVIATTRSNWPARNPSSSETLRSDYRSRMTPGSLAAARAPSAASRPRVVGDADAQHDAQRAHCRSGRATRR